MNERRIHQIFVISVLLKGVHASTPLPTFQSATASLFTQGHARGIEAIQRPLRPRSRDGLAFSHRV
jgi:hypothetical protein